MARRRASMREGPLAELFRATEAAQRQAEGGEQPPAQEAAQIAIPATEPEERTVEHVPSWEEASRAEIPAPPTPRPDPTPAPAPDPVLPPSPGPPPPLPLPPSPEPQPPQIRHEPPPPRYTPPPATPAPPQIRHEPPAERHYEASPGARYADPLPEQPARLNRAPYPDSGAYLAVI